jgi:ubiquinone/menaquinone biosynthesis C-methylase UbiE
MTEQHSIGAVADYWTGHNVTNHHRFSSVEDSLEFLSWRNDQYLGFPEIMPVNDQAGRRVLDFGCGPGHDLVGLGLQSPGAVLTGTDLSSSSLDEAKARCDLHGLDVRLIQLSPQEKPLPFADGEFDTVLSSGVLHHTPDERRILREFHRVLAPAGRVRIMVYNYDSIWTHLYVAFVKMISEGLFGDLPIREAFARTTDGEACPIARCYTDAEFSEICRDAGFRVDSVGSYISVWEMNLLPQRFPAVQDRRLRAESRQFLTQLRFNDRGMPLWQGKVAGVGLCLELTKLG